MLLGANALIQVVPGLMIWTLVAFGITLFVLKRYAFGPIQKVIDERRERLRSSIEEADLPPFPFLGWLSDAPTLAWTAAGAGLVSIATGVLLGVALPTG